MILNNNFQRKTSWNYLHPVPWMLLWSWRCPPTSATSCWVWNRSAWNKAGRHSRKGGNLADQTHCQQEGAQRRNNSHSLMHLKHFLGVCENPMCCWLLCPCCHMGFLWLSAAPGWLQLRYYFQKIKTMSRTSLISFLDLSKAAVREVSRYKPPLLTLHIGTGTIINIKTVFCVCQGKIWHQSRLFQF